MTALAKTGTVLVANHRGRAPIRDVLEAIDQLGPSTADTIGRLLDVPTADVLGTLNQLRRGGVVRRDVISDPSDPRRTLPATWDIEPITA